ncbi:MAG: DUF362 domain-containing protein [Thermodesulfobacteriota bacterium]|nr:DUF362 domain-containing protein [Thermodesulfobacteriota bacterium]
MKKAIITGAVITASPAILVRKSPAAWARKTNVHPQMNPLRVAGITDPRMTKGTEVASSWARQNELVVPEVVWENIDKMACTLAETKAPQEAWRTIFVKPPQKSWTDTVVAIKTNNIALQHTRSAVMAKTCHTLTNHLGVKPSNIYIYDGVHGSKMSRNTPFAGMPEGCRIVDKWGGVNTLTPVPDPWISLYLKSECLKALVDGTVDILINMAMCKGHSTQFGGFTMTMKNHFGTFSPAPGHQEGALDYLLAINQTPEILGQMDKRTGRVVYPRQQLCFIDALWASKGGPGGLPSHQPNFLAMGVFSPVVDYLVATRFRGEKMGWRPNMEATRRFLTDFGYSESDLPAGGKIIEP